VFDFIPKTSQICLIWFSMIWSYPLALSINDTFIILFASPLNLESFPIHYRTTFMFNHSADPFFPKDTWKK